MTAQPNSQPQPELTLILGEAVPEDQREDLLSCYFRELDYALGWLQETHVKAERLARLRYLTESAARLERAIKTLM